MSVNLLLFLVLAGLAVLSALGMLLSRNALYSALYLIINFVTVAVMYLTLHAPFIAIVQITVYTGAIMVLFVFVIMLLGAEQIGTRHPQRWFLPLAIFLGAVLLIETVYIVLYQRNLTPAAVKISAEFGSPKAIGELLFNQYLLPFEATSILLLIAMIGAIVLTKEAEAAKIQPVAAKVQPVAAKIQPVAAKGGYTPPGQPAGSAHPAGTGGDTSPDQPVDSTHPAGTGVDTPPGQPDAQAEEK